MAVRKLLRAPASGDYPRGLPTAPATALSPAAAGGRRCSAAATCRHPRHRPRQRRRRRCRGHQCDKHPSPLHRHLAGAAVTATAASGDLAGAAAAARSAATPAPIRTSASERSRLCAAAPVTAMAAASVPAPPPSPTKRQAPLAQPLHSPPTLCGTVAHGQRLQRHVPPAPSPPQRCDAAAAVGAVPSSPHIPAGQVRSARGGGGCSGAPPSNSRAPLTRPLPPRTLPPSRTPQAFC